MRITAFGVSRDVRTRYELVLFLGQLAMQQGSQAGPGAYERVAESESSAQAVYAGIRRGQR